MLNIKRRYITDFWDRKVLNTSIYARVDGLCYQPIKTFEVNLREFVTAVINDYYIPKLWLDNCLVHNYLNRLLYQQFQLMQV